MSIAFRLAGIALVVTVVVFVRTFGFAYFHGDHVALAGLGRLLVGA